MLLTGFVNYGQWDETDKIVASDRQPDDEFSSYNAVSIYGDYAVAGASRADHSGLANAGAAYVYKRDNNCNWNQVQKLTADVPFAQDYFGFAVAIFGDFIVISSRNHDYDLNNLNYMSGSGAAFIFQNIGGTWTQTQKIVSGDRENGGAFGHDLDITSRRIIVGSWGDDSGAGVPNVFNAGAAYIFEYNGITWNQSQKLVASDRGASDWFGGSVAISYNNAVVGAHRESQDVNGLNTMTYSGSAYVFEKVGGVWNEVQKLTSSDRGQDEYFGQDVDIEGPYIIAGVTSDYQDENGTNSLIAAGSAFIFERDYTTGTWPISAKIDASDRATGDRFGYSVAITKGKAVVGAWFEGQNATGGATQAYAGSAYVFELTGSWNEVQKIVASDRASSDRFGSSAAIYDDRLIIGAIYEDEDDAVIPGNTMSKSGSAYIFESVTQASQPTISATSTSFCPGNSITLSISTGYLNDAANWQWYSGSCNSTPIGTGPSITVTPGVATTYYANGVGNCVNPGLCGSITLTPNLNSWHQTTKNTIGGQDITRDVITESNGNVYVTGSFVNKTVLNGGNNSDLVISTNTGNQIGSYIAKYSPCGDLLWEAHTSGSKDNQANSIVLDEVNQIAYIAGNFVSNLKFVSPGTSCGSGPVINVIGGGPNGYVAGFKMANGCINSLDPVFNNLHTTANAITINEGNGDIFVGGQTSPNYNGSSYTSYIHKYQPSGGSIGGIVSDINSAGTGVGNKVNDMDYDENNHRLWAIGDFDTKMKFLPGSILTVQMPGSTVQDAFLIAYEDNTGGLSPLINRIGNALKFMSGEGISIDPVTGNSYFVGTFQKNVNTPFQFPGINSLPNLSGNNAYMIGFDINTSTGWARYGNVPGSNAYGKSVVYKNNRVYYTGNYNRNNINIQAIGLFPYVTSGAALTNNHVFIACYKPNGLGDWGNVTTDPLSNTGAHNAMSITADDQGHAFVVGKYFKTMDYLITAGSPQLNSTGVGKNGFILRAQTATGSLFLINNDTPLESLKEAVSAPSIKVTPNPTAGYASYTIENYDETKSYNIRILNAQGKIIHESTPSASRFKIDITNHKAGLYFVQLSDGSFTSYCKVVKVD